MSHMIGVDPTTTTAGTTTDGAGAPFKLGTKMYRHDGSLWMFVQAAEAISQYMAVGVDEKGQASKLTSALALVSYNIGFAQVAFADNDFGWVLLDAAGNQDYKIGVLSACDSDVDLNTSATAGYLDDTYTTFVPLVGVMIATTLASTGGATAVFQTRVHLGLRTSGV